MSGAGKRCVLLFSDLRAQTPTGFLVCVVLGARPSLSLLRRRERMYGICSSSSRCVRVYVCLVKLGCFVGYQ